MDEEPSTEELRSAQEARARAESEQARESSDEAETETHDRRAQRAAYLKRKLEERAESEARKGTRD